MLTTATFNSSGSDGERLMISWNWLVTLRANAGNSIPAVFHFVFHRSAQSWPAYAGTGVSVSDVFAHAHPFQALDKDANAVIGKF